MSAVIKTLLTQSAVGGALRFIPKIQSIYANKIWLKRMNLFFGVYGSYAEALANIPRSKAAGWDVATLANGVVRDRTELQPSTYAAMFWISQLLQENDTVIDLGGGAGVTYFAYVRRKLLPDGAIWRVIEVPAIAERGKSLAEKLQATSLYFDIEFKFPAACKIFLSAGCLQYMERSVPGLLDHFAEKPQTIILNKVPLTKGENFWTLQSLGSSISPYRIYNEPAFLDYFLSAGYVLKDRWEVAELSCDIPFYPRRRVPKFSGLYFTRTG